MRIFCGTSHFPNMWVFLVSTVLPGLGYVHTLMVGSFDIWLHSVLDYNNERYVVQILNNLWKSFMSINKLWFTKGNEDVGVLPFWGDLMRHQSLSNGLIFCAKISGFSSDFLVLDQVETSKTNEWVSLKRKYIYIHIHIYIIYIYIIYIYITIKWPFDGKTGDSPWDLGIAYFQTSILVGANNAILVGNIQ